MIHAPPKTSTFVHKSFHVIENEVFKLNKCKQVSFHILLKHIDNMYLAQNCSVPVIDP